MGLSTATTNQVTVARAHGMARIGRVKFMKNSPNRRECFGFATIELESGESIDVHIHREGVHEWAYDGSDYPAIVKSDRVPSKGTEVFLTEPTDRGVDPVTGQIKYRSEKMIIASTSQFESVLHEIQKRPVYRVWHNGEIVLTTCDVGEILHRFPIDGRNIAYPVGDLLFDRREWHSDEWAQVVDVRDPDSELAVASTIGLVAE